MASLQYTGTNDEEVQAFTGGAIKQDPMDGKVLVSADKQSKRKLSPGDVLTKDEEIPALPS